MRAWSWAFLCLGGFLFAAISLPDGSLPGLPSAWAAQAPGRQGGPVILLAIKGAIGPATTEYLRYGLAQAREKGAVAIVLGIDTPGGLVSSTREIVQAELASPIPILGYVTPSGARAASAGTYLLYASHLAAMAPGTNVGAATPVELGGSPAPAPAPAPAPKTTDPQAPGPRAPEPQAAGAMERKVVNDAVAFMRSLAELQGRNAEWAEDAVRNGASLSANAALQKGVVEIIAPDVDSLLAQADGRRVKVAGKPVTLATAGAPVVAVDPDWRSAFLTVITNPDIAYVLMLLGIYGLIFELTSPGAIFPGALGAVALVTALFALNLLPVSYAGTGLVLLGIGLMAAEAYVPSGLLGVGGAAVFVLGSLFMFDSSIADFKLSLPVIVAAVIVCGGLFAVMLASVLRAHRRKTVSGENALVGRTGNVLSWSGDHGVVQVLGETWRARGPVAAAGIPAPDGSESNHAAGLAAGDIVRVTGRSGLTLTVQAESSLSKENAT